MTEWTDDYDNDDDDDDDSVLLYTIALHADSGSTNLGPTRYRYRQRAAEDDISMFAG